MNTEYTLFETTETHDHDSIYGEHSTSERGYRLILSVKEGNVTFEYQSGTVEGQDRNIEWEQCEPFDVEMIDLDASEVDRLGSDIYELYATRFSKCRNRGN